MRFTRFSAAIFITAALLAGCAAEGSSDNSSDTINETTNVTDTSAEATTIQDDKADTDTISENLPVLSIETVDQSPDVMDFVYLPVSEHVSEAIASWTPGYDMPPAPYYEDCSVTLTSPDGSLLIPPSEAKVKVRGNWTTNYPKKPLRIKFSEKQEIPGLNEGNSFKNWVLLAEYKDGSMLRNKAALYAAREILGADGYYAADSDLVQVVINGEYMGLYLLTEMQQTAKGRVDINEPERDYTGTDIGYFLEYDGYFLNEDELHRFPLDLADNAPLTPYDGKGGSGITVQCLPESDYDDKNAAGITIKSDIYSQEQHDFIADRINNTYRIMYEAAYNHKAYVFGEDQRSISETSEITPRQAVENVVDVKSLVDMYIISELTCDADIYWSSFYMDIDMSAEGSGKLRFEAPWDFDSAMGNRDRCIDGQGFYASNISPRAGTRGCGRVGRRRMQGGRPERRLPANRPACIRGLVSEYDKGDLDKGC